MSRRPLNANLRSQTVQTSESTTEPRSALHGVMLTPAAPSLPHSCKCGARWSGNSTAHCAAQCHRTFTVTSAFDKHRRDGQCIDPATIGLVTHLRADYLAWGYPDSGRRDHSATQEGER